MITPDSAPAVLALDHAARAAAVAAMLMTSIDNCTNAPGFGWQQESGRAEQCGVGSYSAGYDKSPCQDCGSGAVAWTLLLSPRPGLRVPKPGCLLTCTMLCSCSLPASACA